MFTHPAHIPVAFALAVHAVLHNQATERQWAAIDAASSRKQALKWIASIYKANDSEWTEKEEQWWLQQFATLDN
jgi:hypothetical protein